MDFYGSSNLLLTTAVIAICLFLLLPKLNSAQNANTTSCPLPNCSAVVTSLGGIQSGARPTNFSVQDRFIEIEFRLRLVNECCHAVRLEVGLQSAASSNTTKWQPIRLDYSHRTPSSHQANCSNWILIREYICGQFVHNFNEGMKLKLRWMREFVNSSRESFDVKRSLDGINIRIWNGTCFLQALSEKTKIDYYGVESHSLKLNCTPRNKSCNCCLFMEPAMANKHTSHIITVSQTDISESCENNDDMSTAEIPNLTSTTTTDMIITENTTTIPKATTETIPKTVITPVSTIPKTVITPVSTQTIPLIEGEELVSKLFREGDSEKRLDDLISVYNGTLPQTISNIVIESAVDTINNISKEADYKAGGRVLKTLDSFALRGYNSRDGRVSNKIFTLVVREVSLDEYMNFNEDLKVLQEPEGAISLPGELLSAFASEVTGIHVASFTFKNLSGVLPIDTEDDNTNHSRLGSPVLSATLGCMGRSCSSSDYTLKNPVIIEIHHISVPSGNMEPGCFFFDLEKNIWSSRGCNRNSIMSNSSFSVCECNHLTHFAILLSPGIEINAEDKFALETISYVGVAFSVFCMIATIFTLTFLKALWGMRIFIHVNLCICLITSQVVFVAAVDQTTIEELCQAIAVVLHYFFLATFMWMLMEGVVLYIVLVRVFIKRQYLYIIGFTTVSYGLPALYVFCVAVPLGLTIKDDQGHPQYGSSSVSQVCWLRYDTHFIWAFITPVLVIIIANIGFFIMAICIMWKHKKRVSDESKLINASHWLKTIISLMVVMGITWIIGVLVFHETLIFVAYIFAIATAFQGSFIFLLFVVMSKQVRDHYRSWWRSKKGESKLLTNLFSSFGNVGWSNSSKATRSESNSATKGKALHNNLGRDKAAPSGLQLTNMQVGIPNK